MADFHMFVHYGGDFSEVFEVKRVLRKKLAIDEEK
jgi:hypothetical protein